MCFSVYVVQNLNDIEKEFGAKPYRDSFEIYERRHLQDPKTFKSMVGHPQIYPNYYAPVVTQREGELVVEPMRYRLRPSWSKEGDLPAKYNLFNARLDALLERKSWKNIFTKNHGLLLFSSFYEWVVHPETHKKKIITFQAFDHRILVAPVLFDTWGAGENELRSFAIITTDPPKEVQEAGHDRCPVILDKHKALEWVHTENGSKEVFLDALKNKKQPVFVGKYE